MDCNIIRDLLPLYVDGCCSAESTALVEEHLKSCEGCREICRQMRGGSSVRHEMQVAPRLHRLSEWKASLLQSVMLFVSFAILTIGVVLEGSTPAGERNGLWAMGLIVPAAGYLLSLANWFFLRLYAGRRLFSRCCCAVTFGMTALGYAWAFIHYEGLISPQVWIGAVLTAVFCVLSKVLSNQYALLSGKE